LYLQNYFKVYLAQRWTDGQIGWQSVIASWQDSAP